jgi:hypothetical protein
MALTLFVLLLLVAAEQVEEAMLVEAQAAV